MTDIAELMSRNPLEYSKDRSEVKAIVAKLREMRGQFNLGAIKSTKPAAKPRTTKASAALAGTNLKLNLSSLLGGPSAKEQAKPATASAEGTGAESGKPSPEASGEEGAE